MKKILIIDIDCAVDPIVFSDFGLQVVLSNNLTKSLLNFEIWRNIDPWRTLLIFPGNGSNLVKQEIKKICPQWLGLWPYKKHVSAKRFWMPGEHPIAYVGDIGKGVYIGLNQVIIIDDVISSGETCLKLYKNNNIYTPGARWLSVGWVAQKSAKLKVFSSIMAVEFVGEINKKTPINSLSTLIANQEICRIYSERNFFDRAIEFQSLIKSIS